MKRESITFARNLKNLRNSQKLTMQQIAEKLGAVRQTVSDWEKGTSSPGIDVLANICKIFDVSADTMMFGNILDEVNFEDNYEEHKRVIFPRKNEGEEPKGIYRPIDVDIDYIDDVWNITVIDFCERLVIALGLSRMGYKITDIYEQGFTVLLSLNVVEEQLKHDIFEIMDHLIHHDDAYLCQKMEGFSNKFARVESNLVNDTLIEIIGKDPSGYKYYVVNEYGAILGYANSIAECTIIIDEQQDYSKKYEIMDVQE